MYPPNNPAVYSAANESVAGFYSGQLAVANHSWYAQLADAWADAVDTAWGSGAYTTLDLQNIGACSVARFMGQGAGPNGGGAPDAAAYATDATEIVALVRATTAQVVARGISPNVPSGAGVIVQTASGRVVGPIALNNSTFTTIVTAAPVVVLPGQSAILSAKTILDVASGGTVFQDVSLQLVDEAGNVYDASEETIQGIVAAQASATVPCLADIAPHVAFPLHVGTTFTFSLQAKLASGAVVTDARLASLNVAVSN